MISILSLLLVVQVQQPNAPRRGVPDPGVVPSGQRVSPAGVRSVFEGRVTGVRFGERSDELWVAVPGAAYHLAWSDGRTLARAAFDGRPGVHAVAIDRVRHRALVSSVGRLPESATVGRLPGSRVLARSRSVAQLGAFDAAARGEATPVASSASLGEFIAGGPAVASRAGASGIRYAVVPLPAEDRLALLDADADTLVADIPLGVAPIDAAIDADGSTAWVTVMAGSKPTSTGERSAHQCCDPDAEAVRVDARGIAMPGAVTAIDLATRRVIASITVGLHPTGLAWDEARGRLYVVDGNSDALTVVDTRARTVAATVAIAPFAARRIGLAPTAVALAPDGSAVYVALGGVNAVAVYAVGASGALSLRGLLPTDWYPSSLDVSADGRHLAVGALLGVGSGEGSTPGSPGKTGRYVHADRGSVNVIAIPRGRELDAYTTAVATNVHLRLATPSGDEPPAAPRRGVAARAVPERPGEPSLIDHVVLIVRENRTYDQLLGDLGRGDGDSALTIYGRAVTPNTHALAERFVTLDRTFANGGNSADGHQWLTQANETEYTTWPLYLGRSYPFSGVDPLAYSSGGFLWEAARDHARSVVVFGEYAPNTSDTRGAIRNELLAAYREHGSAPDSSRRLLAARYETHSPIPSLDSILVREYPGWTLEIPDVVKADVVLAHLREWERSGSMPNLVILVLPSDHTVAARAGWSTPAACVADNDLALGTLVDALSHSSFWKSMAIFAIEDDAQNGVDHVDGHRTVSLVASPYARRGAIDHTFYSQTSVLKTIELMLGLPALSIFDLTATEMRASFIAPGERPDLTPYTALVPAQSLYETNPRLGEIRGRDAGARRAAARASGRMNFRDPDAAPTEAVNRILWHAARGWATPYPAVQHALFMPLSSDVDDDDRYGGDRGRDR